MKRILLLLGFLFLYGTSENYRMTVHSEGAVVHYEVAKVDSITFTVVDTTIEQIYQDVLALVNKSRSEGCLCGSDSMPPVDSLSWNELLGTAALNHSIDMDTNNFLSHTSSDSSTLADRLAKVGYAWSAIAENVAMGYTSAEQAVTGWLSSEGHCKNIMSENYTELGVGKSGTYWTQVYGRPK